MISAVILLAALLLAALPVIAAGAVAFAMLAMLGAVLSGVAVLLAAGVFAGKGILLGMVLGFFAYCAARKARKAGRMAERKEEDAACVADAQESDFEKAYHGWC